MIAPWWSAPDARRGDRSAATALSTWSRPRAPGDAGKTRRAKARSADQGIFRDAVRDAGPAFWRRAALHGWESMRKRRPSSPPSMSRRRRVPSRNRPPRRRDVAGRPKQIHGSRLAYDRAISLFPNSGPAQQARIAKVRLIQGTQPTQVCPPSMMCAQERVRLSEEIAAPPAAACWRSIRNWTSLLPHQSDPGIDSDEPTCSARRFEVIPPLPRLRTAPNPIHPGADPSRVSVRAREPQNPRSPDFDPPSSDPYEEHLNHHYRHWLRRTCLGTCLPKPATR